MTATRTLKRSQQPITAPPAAAPPMVDTSAHLIEPRRNVALFRALWQDYAPDGSPLA